jgi:predicted hotdog family 3-hydroxylacyl-ACP dehydratase
MIPESESTVVVSSHSDVELAGYHACAREAVLYLVNTEKLPANDPLVIALAEHLHKRQAHVEYQCLLKAIGENKHNSALRSQLVLAAYKGCDLNYS